MLANEYAAAGEPKALALNLNGLIGMASTILNRAVIGTGSVVAAGALVPEGMKVPPGSLVMGVPGRVIRAVDDQLRERIQMTWVHYIEQARRHRAGTGL